jgi:hypothetical protein
MNQSTPNGQDMAAILTGIYLFIRRYFIILILFLLAGTATGIYKKFNASGHTAAHVIFSSPAVSNNMTLNLITALSPYISNGNSDILAEKLVIPAEAAASIMSIDTGSIKSRKNIGFWLDINIRDKKWADTITSGITAYVNNNEFFRYNSELYFRDKQNILKLINNRLGISGIEDDSLPNTDLQVSGVGVVEYINMMEKKSETELDIIYQGKLTVVEKHLAEVAGGRSMTKSIILYGLLIFIPGLLLCLVLESLRIVRLRLKQMKS